MRILHIVTLITPDGAYGGPVTVAVNQARELVRRGHNVSIAAASRGFAQPPTELDGIQLHLFPAARAVPRTGFAGLTSPRLLRWLRRSVRQFDVVHIHLARDLVTLPAAQLSQSLGVATVVQTHGMIDPSPKISATAIDLLLTRRVLRSSAQIFYLTLRERGDLVNVGAPENNLRELPNGVPIPPRLETDPDREVLFVSRLHPRKRPLAFVEAAIELAPEFKDWKFTLIGPDEGEGQRVRALISETQNPNISWEGPISPSAVQDRLQRARLFALPSIDEPFPMAVLEAMASGLPVVVTNTCGLANHVSENEAGIVCQESHADLAKALRSLLSNPIELKRLARNARTSTEGLLSISSIADRIETAYQDLRKN